MKAAGLVGGDGRRSSSATAREASEMKKAANCSNRGGALSVGDVGGGGRCGALIEAREADDGGSES